MSLMHIPSALKVLYQERMSRNSMSNLEDFANMEPEIRMGMNLVDRNEFRATIQAISHIAADTVKKTLGPYAHTTIIDDGHFTYPTKDGWSVLSRLTFQDPTHNSIFNVLKNISFRIVDKVGDGTTTAMVAADHFINSMIQDESFHETYRQKDIVDALDHVRDLLVAELRRIAIQIAPENIGKVLTPDDYQAIYDVAYTSSNGNAKLAEIMRDIYFKTNNPNILVDMEGGTEISYEIQTGYRLDCVHLMHERYVNTSEGYYSSMHVPHMFIIFDHSVNYQRHSEMIDIVIRYANQNGAVPVIMAPYFDDIISAQFAQSVNEMLKKNPSVIPGLFVIQLPEASTKLQRQYIQDFAALANIPITDSSKVKIFAELRHNERVSNPNEKINDPAMQIDGYNFTTAQKLMESCCGVITDFTIGKNFIALNEANRDSVRYKEKLAEAQEEYEKASEQMHNSPTSLMKDYLDASQRLNKLSGALGVIHVGGASDLERQCTRDSVDDTFRACRSAYENGIVPGLNLGTLVAIQNIMGSPELSDLDNEALNMLYAAMQETAVDVLTNKKKDGSIWAYDADSAFASAPEIDSHEELINTLVEGIRFGELTGYDIVSEKICRSRIPSVINSVSTDIEILNAIVSILGLILTSDQYLSVSRMYDKTAAIRHQERQNTLTTKNRIITILSTLTEYLGDHPDTTQMIGNIFGAPLQLTGSQDGHAVMCEYDNSPCYVKDSGYQDPPFTFGGNTGDNPLEDY